MLRITIRRLLNIGLNRKKASAVPVLAATLTSWLVAGPALCRSSFASAEEGASAPKRSKFPIQLTNCGRPLHFGAPPRRVAALDQITTELMLHLGAVDRIVLTANQSDPPFFSIAGEYASLARLDPARNYPTAEALLAANPDFVAGNLAMLSFSQSAGFGGPLTRAELASRGIASFALVCEGEAASNELLFKRYVELGRILGREAEAEQTIEEVQASLRRTAQVFAGSKPVRTFIYIDGRGPLQTLRSPLALAGGENIVGPHEGGCCPPTVPIEVVASRDPQAILVSSFGALSPHAPPLSAKQAALEKLLPSTRAVLGRRFLKIDFISFSTPQRIARDARSIARFLHPDLRFDR